MEQLCATSSVTIYRIRPGFGADVRETFCHDIEAEPAHEQRLKAHPFSNHGREAIVYSRGHEGLLSYQELPEPCRLSHPISSIREGSLSSMSGLVIPLVQKLSLPSLSMEASYVNEIYHAF